MKYKVYDHENRLMGSFSFDPISNMYRIKDAKRDSDNAILSSHNHRHITKQSPHCKHCTMRKLPPHIIILLNDPCPDCNWCGGTGTYYSGLNRYDCLCRTFGREPLPCEINKEFNQQTL